jgi:hypothetical protein
VLPFTVYECSSYEDKHRPDWEQMEKLAIDITPVRVSAKMRGFSAVETLRPLQTQDDEDEDAEEVALNQ